MDDPDVMCICRVMEQIPESDVPRYVRSHLTKVDSDPETWVETYECPRTGARWIGDYPHSEMHGGGPMRLRSFTRVSREVWTHLFYVRQLLDDDIDAIGKAGELRLLLERRYPGTDPVRR